MEQEQASMPPGPAIVVEGLGKRYGDYRAVDQLDLQVGGGEIFGFLGPNGAGKTTTIKMLAGLLQPDGGRILINGRDLRREPVWCKQQTGYIPDRPYLYEKLTGLEFLQFIASLYRVPVEQFRENVDYYIPLFDLRGWEEHLIESYSHGMRQKLIMSAALLVNPPILIVDEPMVGLDPKSARIVKELFKKFAAAGGSIFLSTARRSRDAPPADAPLPGESPQSLLPPRTDPLSHPPYPRSRPRPDRGPLSRHPQGRRLFP